MPTTTRPVWAAVLPSAPDGYDQAYMSRAIDVINKLIEQILEPRQLTAACAVFSDLPHETPRFMTEGEVYTKICGGCGATVLAIHQTIPEEAQHAQRQRLRARSVIITPAAYERDARDRDARVKDGEPEAGRG